MNCAELCVQCSEQSMRVWEPARLLMQIMNGVGFLMAVESFLCGRIKGACDCHKGKQKLNQWLPQNS